MNCSALEKMIPLLGGDELSPGRRRRAEAHLRACGRCRAEAKAYRKEYNEHMNIQDGRPKPACHIQDQDVNYPWGWDRLTHPRRRR